MAIMMNLFDRRAKTAPSSYPRILFHGIRLCQLLASVVVGGIMSYFIWHLTHDHWSTPWTFIWLTAASLFSIAALAFTIVLHCCFGLNARFNLAVNAFLLVLWALSWSLLTWFMSGTLKHMCDLEHWNEVVGVMICRIYKALFSFTLLGLIATLSAFVLDIFVHRKNTSRGVYRLHDLDHKKLNKRTGATRGLFTEEGHGRESEAWEAPRSLMDNFSEQPGHTQQQGYAVPDGQFDYDTGYGNGRHHMR